MMADSDLNASGVAVEAQQGRLTQTSGKTSDEKMFFSFAWLELIQFRLIGHERLEMARWWCPARRKATPSANKPRRTNLSPAASTQVRRGCTSSESPTIFWTPGRS